MKTKDIKKISRVDFFKTGALITLGATGIGMVGSLFTPEEANAQGVGNESKTTWPLAYPSAGLNAATARIRAHDAYWSGKGCSYATFEGIVSCLRDTMGGTYNDIPTEILIYGHGGGSGWGATCGTINGAAAAISLVCAKAVSDPMVSELYGWFTQNLFPSTAANTIAINNGYGVNTYNMNLGQSMNHSPLCHVAVSNWCNEQSVAVGANERKERCARMCGDVVVKAIEMLNGYYASGTYTATYVAPALNATCLSCHGTAGSQHDVAANMECESCHGADVYPHSTGKNENIKEEFSIEQNYPNPFSETTTLRFQLENPEAVTIEIYSLNGIKIKTLANDEMFSAGHHTINWDGCTQKGDKVAPGMYFFNIVTSKGKKSLNMMKL